MVDPAAVTARADGIERRVPGALIRVTALTDAILRVRWREGRLDEDASWAVPAAVRAQHVAVRATADGFATAALHRRMSTRRRRG